MFTVLGPESRGKMLGEEGAVMPVKTGIQVCFRFKFKSRLDSGFRRNDESTPTGMSKYRLKLSEMSRATR